MTQTLDDSRALGGSVGELHWASVSAKGELYSRGVCATHSKHVGGGSRIKVAHGFGVVYRSKFRGGISLMRPAAVGSGSDCM